MKYNRQIDLSKQLDEQDLKALQKAFKSNGWECGTAEILTVARNNASSNHWKDIIWNYLQSKTKQKDLTPSEANKEEENKSTTTPPKKERSSSSKKGE